MLSLSDPSPLSVLTPAEAVEEIQKEEMERAKLLCLHRA